MPGSPKSKAFLSFYRSKAWRELRLRVLNKYGRNCMCCGSVTRGRNTHIDHIEPRSKRPDLELDFANLQVLCKDCNTTKSGDMVIDYRPGESTKTPTPIKIRTASHWSDGYSTQEIVEAIRHISAFRKKQKKPIQP